MENTKPENTPKLKKREESLLVNTEIELKGKNQAKNVIMEYLFVISNKNRDYI